MNEEELRENIGKELWLSEKTRVTKREIKLLWEKSKMVVVNDADDKDWTQVQKYGDFFKTKQEAFVETEKKIKERIAEIVREKEKLENYLDELKKEI